MSEAAGPLTDIHPQPPNAAIKLSAGRAKIARQILTEISNLFCPCPKATICDATAAA
jgi:hypothetical protein